VKSALAGLALGAAVGAIVAIGACAGTQHTDGTSKRGEITALWTQIRDWRREAHMDLDPSMQTVFQVRALAVKDTKRVCSEGHKVPTTCDDVCSLADAICDNAETICSIAEELGKDDYFAQDKCSSAKGSCREAKQKCCGCSNDAVKPVDQ
jgi:hypothetical protein